MIESMFSVKNRPWHGLGTPVEEALTSSDALRAAGLDWTIESLPIFDVNGIEIKGFRANTRSSDGSVKGIVGERYTIVQNADAFAFTDALVGEGLLYESAGAFRGGRAVWLLGKMPERYICGDLFETYICFVNSHDGSGSVRACMTPTRVECNNILNLVFKKAQRSWSTPHRGDVMGRMEEARQTLQLADQYMNALEEKADQMANQTMSDSEIIVVLDKMFWLPPDATERQKKTVDTAKNEIVCCMLHPDIAQFINTRWGFINAVADYVDHADPVRQTKHYAENRWSNIIGGHALLDRAMALMGEVE